MRHIPKSPLSKNQWAGASAGFSSHASDFNYDYHVSFRREEIATGKVYHNFQVREAVSEEPAGNSVFYKDQSGTVFHTYSTYGRGDELLVGAAVYLDLTPNGRNETIRGNLTDWVRHHDRYDAVRLGWRARPAHVRDAHLIGCPENALLLERCKDLCAGLGGPGQNRVSLPRRRFRRSIATSA